MPKKKKIKIVKNTGIELTRCRDADQSCVQCDFDWQKNKLAAALNC